MPISAFIKSNNINIMNIYFIFYA